MKFLLSSTVFAVAIIAPAAFANSNQQAVRATTTTRQLDDNGDATTTVRFGTCKSMVYNAENTIANLDNGVAKLVKNGKVIPIKSYVLFDVYNSNNNNNNNNKMSYLVDLPSYMNAAAEDIQGYMTSSNNNNNNKYEGSWVRKEGNGHYEFSNNEYRGRLQWQNGGNNNNNNGQNQEYFSGCEQIADGLYGGVQCSSDGSSVELGAYYDAQCTLFAGRLLNIYNYASNTVSATNRFLQSSHTCAGNDDDSASAFCYNLFYGANGGDFSPLSLNQCSAASNGQMTNSYGWPYQLEGDDVYDEYAVCGAVLESVNNNDSNNSDGEDSGISAGYEDFASEYTQPKSGSGGKGWIGWLVGFIAALLLLACCVFAKMNQSQTDDKSEKLMDDDEETLSDSSQQEKTPPPATREVKVPTEEEEEKKPKKKRRFPFFGRKKKNTGK